MTPEYQQELKQTLEIVNKFTPGKFQLLSQDVPPETMELLKQMDTILPSDSYISRSWLLQQLHVLGKDLSNEQKTAIKKGIKFFDDHRADYAKLKENPTFEQIKQKGLANCGDLASAFVSEFQQGKHISRSNIGNYTFFRVAIDFRNFLADSMPSMKKMDSLRHIFLAYSTDKNATLEDIVKSFCQSDSPQALDLWSRKAGNTRTLVDNILDEVESNNATLKIQDPRTGETARLSYDKDKKTFSIQKPQGLCAYFTDLKNKGPGVILDSQKQPEI